jgi:hypothetical protein
MPDPTKPDTTITFADGFAPPLPAGRYTMRAEQRLEISSERDPIEFKAEKAVDVSAPRFVLNPGEVYSVYPPAGQAGAFHEALPHIVLTRKTLPWERNVDGVATEEGQIRAPWMALLTIDDDEIADNKIEINSIALREFYNPPAEVLGPKIKSEDGERLGPPPAEEDHCVVATMPAPLFRDIAPAGEELRFLAHARKIGPGEKDLADAVADGWVAAVVGNRRPKPYARNHGLLVSLEGLGGVLKKRRSDDAALGWAGKRVQPVVLHHWTYMSKQKTFDQILKGLTKKDGAEKDVWLRVLPDQNAPPSDAVQVLRDPSASPSSKALAALTLGYTALAHNLRQGGRTVSWYRGPLIPMPVPTSTYHAIHVNADDALQYDPGTGFFNVSYAAAWQLGRLLALQNLEVATSLLHRTDGYIARGALEEAKKMLNSADKTDIEEKAKLLLQDELMVGLLAEWWLSDPANAGGNSGGLG